MWVRIEDTFYDHPKIIAAGNAAVGLHVRGLSYACHHMTDGKIPRSFLKGQLKTAERLVLYGLWERDGEDYRIHDYLKFNPSAREIQSDREIWKRRAAMNANPDLARTVKNRDENTCRYCGRVVDWRDRKSPLGGTYDHVIPLSQGGDESPENIVVCCRTCNFKKQARTPEQAGMSLVPVRTPERFLDIDKSALDLDLEKTKTIPRQRPPILDSPEITPEQAAENRKRFSGMVAEVSEKAKVP